MENKINNAQMKLILKNIGFERTWLVQNRLIAMTGIFTLIGLIIFVLTSFVFRDAKDIDIASAIIACGALVFAYQQWVETKHENSIDKYYERLTLTNNRLNDWAALRPIFSEFWHYGDTNSFEKSMYVYLELDNLEYSIIKYRYGYMSPYMAYRSLLTFISRCQSPEFLDLAQQCVNKSIGYQDITEEVVNNIANPNMQKWLREQLSFNLFKTK